MLRPALFSLLVVVLSASPAAAQRDRLLVEPSPPAEWGFTFSLTPKWDFVPLVLTPLAGVEKEQIRAADGSTTLNGSSWSIGFVRGRALGTDWGISFVQQRIAKGSLIDRRRFYSCTGNTTLDCVQGERLTLTDVTVIGPEFHLYVPFGTVRERVQFGILLAGGAGAFRGQGVEQRFETTFSGTGTPIISETTAEGDITATQIYFGEPYTLFGRVEPGVAVLVGPQVRVFASAGFHYPGSTYFSLRATYFFPRAMP